MSLGFSWLASVWSWALVASSRHTRACPLAKALAPAARSVAVVPELVTEARVA